MRSEGRLSARGRQPIEICVSAEWFVLDSGRGDFAFNMALDEALLESAAATNRPVLRFYGWTQAAASFGYFQKIAEIERATSLRPLVRRPTGGGLVPHDRDWTYSVVIPPHDSWYRLAAVESYARIHRWIQSAFARLNLKTTLAPACRKEIPGQCFAGHEKSDLLWLGRKIAGAAQRRTKTGLLIQGSIQPPPPGISRVQWQDAMRAAAESEWSGHFETFAIPLPIRQRAELLAAEKFSGEDHNRRR
jgi:lipoate-protein ligase A